MQCSVLQRGERVVDLEGLRDVLRTLRLEFVMLETADANRIEASWAADIGTGEHTLVMADSGG